MSGVRLNLGCGRHKREGWVNVDDDPRHKPDVRFDLSMRLPWGSGEVDEIEAYHLIEHLPLPDARVLLRECLRVLGPGGTIALECPDLAALCALYATSPRRATLSIYGRQENGDGMRHRYGYSRETLAALLKTVGFHVTHAGEGTDYHAKEEPCIRVEAVKP